MYLFLQRAGDSGGTSAPTLSPSPSSAPSSTCQSFSSSPPSESREGRQTRTKKTRRQQYHPLRVISVSLESFSELKDSAKGLHECCRHELAELACNSRKKFTKPKSSPVQGSRFVCRRKWPPVGGDFRRQTKRDPCTIADKKGLLLPNLH